MATQKRWYDTETSQAVRVISRYQDEDAYFLQKWRHARVRPGLGECLLYPLTDGPGIGLLLFFPPILFVLSLPVFDFIAIMEPLKRDWTLGLMITPVFMPLMFSFLMVFGYTLLFLGHILIASAMGENEHPRWPEWHPADICEGVGRWIWAVLLGAVTAGLPLLVWWILTHNLAMLRSVAFIDFVLIGTVFGQMALAAALMHDTILAANPITIFAAIVRIGWGYVLPCLVGCVAVTLGLFYGHSLLFSMPTMWMEAIALWGFWVFTFYAAMVVLRMLGLTYHAYAMELLWFRRRPKWASSRIGRIYVNS